MGEGGAGEVGALVGVGGGEEFVLVGKQLSALSLNESPHMDTHHIHAPCRERLERALLNELAIDDRKEGEGAVKFASTNRVCGSAEGRGIDRAKAGEGGAVCGAEEGGVVILDHRMIIIILWQRAIGRDHSFVEERWIRLPAVRDDVLDDGCAPRRLAEEGHVVGVAAEFGDVVLNPAEGELLVHWGRC